MYVINRMTVGLLLLPILAAFLSCTTAGPPTGSYTIDTFEFVPASSAQNAGTAIPNVWIDTNLKLSSLSGGTMTSSLPCSIKIDYTDNSFAFQAAVLTSVKITYDDETMDASTTALKMPLRIAAREYETVNSVAGGQIVKSTAWITSGTIPSVVTRAESFRLQIDGYFSKDDNNKIPFAIDQRFEIKKEAAVKSAEELLQDK